MAHSALVEPDRRISRIRRSWRLSPQGCAGSCQHQWQPNTTISNFDVGLSEDIPWGKVVLSPFFTQMIGHRTIFGHHSMFVVNMNLH